MRQTPTKLNGLRVILLLLDSGLGRGSNSGPRMRLSEMRRRGGVKMNWSRRGRKGERNDDGNEC